MTVDYTYAKGTKVPVTRSRDEIEGVLEKVGADAIAFMKDSLLTKIAFRLSGRHYVISLERVDSDPQREREQWRQLLLLMKAKLVAISVGVTTAEEEFLAFAMLPTGQTLGEAISNDPKLLTTAGPLALPGGS